MQIRNVTRDTLNLNTLTGSFMILGKETKTIDCQVTVGDQLDIIDAPEVKAAIKKGQLRVIHGERTRSKEKTGLPKLETQSAPATKADVKKGKSGKDKPFFGKKPKPEGTEE